jgi:hypothetical protein
MSVQLSEFKRVNGCDDNLLPVYLCEKEPNIVNKKSLFLSLMGALCFFVTFIGVLNFSKNTTIINSQINDDYFNTNHFTKIHFNGGNEFNN